MWANTSSWFFFFNPSFSLICFFIQDPDWCKIISVISQQGWRQSNDLSSSGGWGRGSLRVKSLSSEVQNNEICWHLVIDNYVEHPASFSRFIPRSQISLFDFHPRSALHCSAPGRLLLVWNICKYCLSSPSSPHS